MKNADKIYAKMILETVLNNHAAFAEHHRAKLYQFLTAALCANETESAAAILQNGIGIDFRKEVLLNLHYLFSRVDPETNGKIYECIGKWSIQELDYALRFSAQDGNLKFCKFQGKWTGNVGFFMCKKSYSFRLKLCRKPYGY
jgi:hypothetical protein